MANILVVDDQACVRELLSLELTSEGHTVTAIGDAESVRTHLKSSRPDLVLLDLHLDGAEGWDVLRDIKEQDPRLPVLIVTAYDSYRDDPRLSVAEGYWIKSLDFCDLKQKIAHVLNRRATQEREVGAKQHFPQVTPA